MQVNILSKPKINKLFEFRGKKRFNYHIKNWNLSKGIFFKGSIRIDARKKGRSYLMHNLTIS